MAGMETGSVHSRKQLPNTAKSTLVFIYLMDNAPRTFGETIPFRSKLVKQIEHRGGGTNLDRCWYGEEPS